MQNGLLAAIVPFDGYPSPIRRNDGTTVGLIVSPANAVANLKESGLVTGHLGAPFQITWPSISAGVVRPLVVKTRTSQWLFGAP